WLFEALESGPLGYIVVGAFARIVHGSAETTSGLDIVPSLREESLRRLGRVLDDLGARAGRKPVSPEQLVQAERLALTTSAGSLTVVSRPWGTRGYDDLRVRAGRGGLRRGGRLAVASSL